MRRGGGGEGEKRKKSEQSRGLCDFPLKFWLPGTNKKIGLRRFFSRLKLNEVILFDPEIKSYIGLIDLDL